MKTPGPRLSAIFAVSLCALCAGAALGQSNVEQRAPQLRTYTVGEIDGTPYEVVGRLWVDSWHSAWWLRTFPTQAEAVAALHTEAARRGADALLNVYCFDQGRRWAWATKAEPSFLCYGLAIRVLDPAKRAGGLSDDGNHARRPS